MLKHKQTFSSKVGGAHSNPSSALPQGRASPRGVGSKVKKLQIVNQTNDSSPDFSVANSNNKIRAYKKVSLQNESEQLLKHRTYFTNKNNLCFDSLCNHKRPIVNPCSKDCFYCTKIEVTPKCPFLNFDSTCGINLPTTISCRTIGVIYLITCEHGKQYIGQTKSKARDRWYKHIYNIKTINDSNAKQVTKANIPSVPITQHFNNNKCDPNKIKFTILATTENCNGNLADELNRLERFFIRLYNTASPFGLNDDIPGFGKISKSSNKSSDDTPYFNFKIKRNNRSHGQKIKQDGTRKRSKRLLLDISKIPLHKIGYLSNRNIKNLTDYTNDKKLQEALVKIEAFKNNCKINKDKPNNQRKLYITLPFLHPALENIGINKIINNKASEIAPLKDYKIMLVWKYSRTIGSYLKNQNAISKSITEREIIKALSTDRCCANIPSRFIHQDAKHVSTNDPSILGPKLNSLLENGQKYRPIPKFNRSQILEAMTNSLNENIDKLTAKTKITRTRICDFITNIKNEISEKISNHSTLDYQFVSIPKKTIKAYKEKFIITGIDKEGGGLSINCPNLYIQAVCKELSIEYVNNKPSIKDNSLFELIRGNINTILNNHTDITRKFNCSPNEPSLPHFYLLAKYHKYPKLKWRTISSCRKTSLSSVSIRLNKILTHIDKHYFNIFSKYNTYKNMKSNWACKSTLEALERIGKFSNSRSLHTYDFSAMYNNIDQKAIISAFNNILTQCFTKYPNYYLDVSKWNCSYTASKKNDDCFNRQDIVYLIETLLDNSYIQFGPLIVRMKTGIFMGSAFGCLLASLTLSYFEHKAVKDPITMEKLNGSYIRYLDDILVQNDKDFLKCVPKIYSQTKLILEKDPSEDGTKVNFLDLKIHLNNNSLKIGVFDKTDNMNMKIFKFFPPNSCVPKNLIINIIFSQILRYLRICNNEGDFKNKVQSTQEKILKLGYTNNIWKKATMKFINKHRIEIVRKFNNQIITFLNG